MFKAHCPAHFFIAFIAFIAFVAFMAFIATALTAFIGLLALIFLPAGLPRPLIPEALKRAARVARTLSFTAATCGGTVVPPGSNGPSFFMKRYSTAPACTPLERRTPRTVHSPTFWSQMLF